MHCTGKADVIMNKSIGNLHSNSGLRPQKEEKVAPLLCSPSTSRPARCGILNRVCVDRRLPGCCAAIPLTALEVHHYLSATPTGSMYPQMRPKLKSEG